MYDYSKILWIDEDWDYAYIIIMLQYKLTRTKNCILENNLREGNEEIAKNIQEIVDLLEIVKEGYSVNYEKLDEKFGKSQIIRTY